MELKRRQFIRVVSSAAAMAALGWRTIGTSVAAEWNKLGFQAKSAAEAIKNIGAAAATPSKDIVIKAPDIAENGAVVPIEVTSRIPNTESIAIIADKNPFPLVASFDFANGAEAYASTRVKMGGTSDVRAIVKADGKYFVAVREVKVTIGGCGG